MKTPLDIKQAADMIGDHLREAGYPVPRHVALELSARLARFRNLHQAQTNAQVPPVPAPRPTILRAILADITTLEVAAIVNSTNSHLLGSNGVTGAIQQAAGPELVRECRRLRGCDEGDAKITSGYQLRAKYIIHTVPPDWSGGGAGEPQRLAACYRRVLDLAAANGITALAFPCIGTGINRYPGAFAAELAVATVRACLGQQSTIQEVIFCCYTETDLKFYQKLLLPAGQLRDSASLNRFVDAQSGSLGTGFSDFRQALNELHAGRKETHWIWYVLPQLRGLGTSEMAVRYGIASREEARAYLDHPLLGKRLRECVHVLQRHKGTDPERIFSPIDAAKYRSCLTLFKAVAGPESVFGEALRDFFQGRQDELTTGLLASLESATQTVTQPSREKRDQARHMVAPGGKIS